MLALEDIEVLDATAVAADDAPSGGDAGAAGERVAASLRVTLRQAVYLAAAQDFAHSCGCCRGPTGDRAHGQAGLRMGALP